jgi:glutathione synthase/RimK-type ligase-like ATP-grasp enzyme
MAMTVAIATCAEHPDLPEGERSLLGALRELGVRAEPAIWDSPSVDWASFEAVILRAAWDYHLKREAFLRWLERLEAAGVPLWNPAPVVRANMEKTYLRALEEAGVPVVPTAWIARGDGRSLDEVLSERGWTRAVVKPVISASSFLTRRVARGEPGGQTALDEVLAHSGAMVQPYLPEIEAEGEWSFIFLDGDFSHAVLKTPARGDFRVQSEHGGAAVRREPPPELLAQAAAVAALGARDVLYARVDGVRRGGGLLLVELELVEPFLYLDEAPGAAGRLAGAIVSRASNLRRHKT